MSQDLQIFVVAPTGRDAPLICDMLAQRGVACRICSDVRELCRRAADGAGGVIVTEEALVPGAMDDLDALFAAQPAWSDIGVILLTSNGKRVQAVVRAKLERRGARSVIVMERPVRVLTLTSTVESVLQSRKRQYELRDHLEERVRNEARYRALFESIDQGFCVIDVLFDDHGDAHDYRFIEANPAFDRQTGLVNAIGKTVRELVPDHEPQWFEIYGRIALTGVPERFERRAAALGRFYEVFAFRVSAPEDRRVAVLFNDIGERKRAELELRASEARERERAAELLAILDAAPMAMFIAQDREGRKMIGNRMTYEALRLPPGANVSKSGSGDEAPTTFRAMRDGREISAEDLPAQKAAATGLPVRNYEFDVVYEDGTCRNMLGEAVPLFDEHGQPRGSVGAFVDITDRKQNEERLRQTQKLESVGLLAGGIAHDFNNLLTGIMGNASMVLDDVGPGPAERIKEVIKAAERAANLTRQLLAYSGQGQFVVRDVDVSEAVNEIRGLVEFSIPRSVNLSVTVQSRLPIVRMDPSQLQQILMNLVINAGEAIGEGIPGEINVATSVADIDQPFVDAAGAEVAPGRYVCIDVRDTGAGIRENEKRKIFDPFFTTKFTGRGLGLAAVAGILRSQKGGITLTSAPGQGTIFRVFLPAAEKRAPGDRESPGGELLGTLLVVDDEASVRDFIGAVLRKQGYRVLPASDGREALATSEQENGAIDGIVLDVVMPLMGAKELLPQLKKRRPNVKVLLTSGYSEAEARRLCAAYPGAAFIQKPYTAQQITRAVAEMLGRSN